MTTDRLPTGRCFYQTPAMRQTAPDYVLPGELVQQGDQVAIKKPNGKFLTLYMDGTDRESDAVFDQELFVVPELAPVDAGRLVLTADRTRYADQMADKGGAKAYFLAVVRV